MEDKQCKIHVTNLKKNFGKLEVLKDISVDVQEGEVVVLLGPSGSGKSTLLRCLNQLETATSGKIIIDGHDVTDKHTDINKVRENIGMVFQHFNLFNHLTVLDNMTLAPVHLKLMNKEEARTEALRLLEHMDRTEKGLTDKLRQAEFSQEAVEDAIAYVKSYGYINDARYARTYISFRMESKSRQKILSELQMKGVDRQTALEAWEEMEELMKQHMVVL